MPNWVRNVVQFYSKHEDAIDDLKHQLRSDEGEEYTKFDGTKDIRYNVFDFNKMVPMPESIKNTCSGSMEESAIKYFILSNKKALPGSPDYVAYRQYLAQKPYRGSFEVPDNLEDIDAMKNDILEREGKYLSESLNIPIEEVGDKLFEIGCTHVDNLIRYGSPDWYDWSVNNWGTKWNSHCPDLIDNGVIEKVNSENDETYFATYELDTAWNAPQPIMESIARQNPEVDFTHMWADEDFGYNCGITQYDHKDNGNLSITTYEPEGGTMPAYLLAAAVREVSPVDLLYMLPTKKRTNLIEIFDVEKFEEF